MKQSRFTSSNLKLVITQHPNPTLMWLVALLGAIVFFVAGYVVYSKIPKAIPLTSNGIISNFTTVIAPSISPYLLFALLFLLTFIGVIVGIKLSTKLSLTSNFVDLISNVAISGMLFTILLSLILKATFNDPGIMVTDHFHDGERLAFWGNINSLKTMFSDIIMIHGPSNNIIPIALAEMFFPNNTIVGFRIILIAQHCIVYFSVYLIIASAVSTMDLNLNPRILALFVIAVIILVGGPLLYFGPKDLFILLLSATIFGYIANYNSKLGVLFGFLTGLIVILSFFYTFNRAIYGATFFIAISIVFAFFGRLIFKAWFISSVLGIITGCFLVSNIFGPGILDEIASIYFFWMENSKLIWGRSPPLINSPEILMAWLIVMFLLIFGVTCTIALFTLSSDERLTKKDAKYKLTLIALFIFAPIFVNDFVYRFYFGKVTDSAFPILLLSILIIVAQLRHFQFPLAEYKKFRILQLSSIFVLTATLGTQSAVIVSKYTAALKLNDGIMIEPDYKEALKQLATLTADQNCFYTMTSEGTWYHLLDKPSCSRFPIVTYARTKYAQRAVIQDLEKQQPHYILLSNRGWSNRIDEVSFFSANSFVVSYILENFKPYSFFESHWVWKSRGHVYPFQRIVDEPNEKPSELISVMSKKDFYLSGEFDNDPDQGLIIYTLADGIPIWAGVVAFQSNSWEATIPAGVLSDNSRRIDVVYLTENDEMVNLRTVAIKVKTEQ